METFSNKCPVIWRRAQTSFDARGAVSPEEKDFAPGCLLLENGAFHLATGSRQVECRVNHCHFRTCVPSVPLPSQSKGRTILGCLFETTSCRPQNATIIQSPIFWTLSLSPFYLLVIFFSSFLASIIIYFSHACSKISVATLSRPTGELDFKIVDNYLIFIRADKD